MAAEIEIEHVEPCSREVVREAPGRQVPGVAVLPEPVDEQHGPEGPLAVRGSLSDHGQRNGTTCKYDFLPERRSLVPVDELLDDALVENHSGGSDEGALP